MWMRRVFYDPTTGEVFRIFSADGNFRLLSQYDEAAICGLSDYACLEWTESDEAIEAAFADVDAEGNARSVNVSVDVSGAEPRLVFAYEPMPEPGTNEAADMAALALLGVAPEEEV